MRVYHDIPYADPDHGKDSSFNLYVPEPVQADAAPLPLICFVHGGAWRSEDKSDHAWLGRRLAELTNCPVALPNYRLTKPNAPLKHPAHAEDLLQFLHFVLDWSGPEGAAAEKRPYDPSRIYALGHSCSAHMLTSIFLSPSPELPSAALLSSLTPSTRLLSAVRGIVLSEGIYDVDLLLQSFPGYKDWFIAATFGDLPSYAAFNTASYRLLDGGEHIRWLVIHSKGDTLVDKVQSEAILHGLQNQLHEKTGKGSAELNWELTADHNDILKEDGYPQIVNAFVVEGEKDPRT